MKRIGLVLMLMLLFACSSNNVWDIDIKKVDKVELFALNNQHKTLEIEDEDAQRLITAFNNIEKKDIYKENSTDLMYLMYPGTIQVTTKTEKINIDFLHTGIIFYNNIEYFLELDSEIFDLLRELELKYDMKFANWEMDLSYEGLDGYFSDGYSSWYFTYSDTSLNKTYEKFNKETRVDDSLTFNDLLKDKAFQLNDVIEAQDMKIVVIGTTNDMVDIVAFKFIEE